MGFESVLTQTNERTTFRVDKTHVPSKSHPNSTISPLSHSPFPVAYRRARSSSVSPRRPVPRVARTVPRPFSPRALSPHECTFLNRSTAYAFPKVTVVSPITRSIVVVVVVIIARAPTVRVDVVVAFFPPPPRARRNITCERTRTRARTRRTSASSPSRSRRARAPPSRRPIVASAGRSPTRPAGRGTKRRVMTQVGGKVSHPGCSAFVTKPFGVTFARCVSLCAWTSV